MTAEENATGEENGGKQALLRVPDAASILGAVPGVVVLIDEVGTVLWINDQVTGFSGHQPEELIGTNMLDHLDVETNPLGLESIGYALDNPGIRLPTILGFRTRSGSTIAVEAVANNQFADPRINAMVVHLRLCDERQLVDRVLSSLATADDIDVVFSHLHRVAQATTLRSEATIILHRNGPAGPSRVIASDPSAGRLVSGADGTTPWRQAADTGEAVLVADVGALPAGLRLEARAAGFEACWAYPIAHLESRRRAAVLVLWRREIGSPEPSATMLADQVVHLTQLALDRHDRTRLLFHAARHDHLTGLANRAHFYDVLDSHLARADDPVGVLYVDLDSFKQVNDGFGHRHGDRVLKAIAARLVGGVSDAATVARLGGDEFAICLPDANVPALTATADHLLTTLAMPIPVDGERHQIGATIGVALSPPGVGRSGDHLVDTADAALLEAKASSKGGWHMATITGPAGERLGP